MHYYRNTETGVVCGLDQEHDEDGWKKMTKKQIDVHEAAQAEAVAAAEAISDAG